MRELREFNKNVTKQIGESVQQNPDIAQAVRLYFSQADLPPPPTQGIYRGFNLLSLSLFSTKNSPFLSVTYVYLRVLSQDWVRVVRIGAASIRHECPVLVLVCRQWGVELPLKLLRVRVLSLLLSPLEQTSVSNLNISTYIEINEKHVDITLKPCLLHLEFLWVIYFTYFPDTASVSSRSGSSVGSVRSSRSGRR